MSASPDLLTASEPSVEGIANMLDAFRLRAQQLDYLLRNEPDQAAIIRLAREREAKERTLLLADFALMQTRLAALEKQLLAVRSVQRYKMGTDGEGSSVWVDPIRDADGEFVAWEDVATAAGAEP